MRLNSVKTQLIIFLAALAVFLSLKDKDGLFLLTLSISVIFCASLDSFVTFLKDKRASLTESSIISGLIIGYVLAGDNPWWKFLAACILAILSKHLIRIGNRHLFNPAAFGVFFAAVLFGATTQWKGTYAWYLLVPFGCYFAYAVRKTELLISYFAVALLLFGIQALLQHTPVVTVFGYLSYFFIFIMMIEPRTTPVRFYGKLIFGAAVAVLIFILTQAGAKFDAELCALLACNIGVTSLNKLL